LGDEICHARSAGEGEMNRENNWLIFLTVWAYSTGNGAEVDQASVGPANQSYKVEADDFDAAKVMAEHFLEGIRRNPRVWKAQIVGIIQQYRMERISNG